MTDAERRPFPEIVWQKTISATSTSKSMRPLAQPIRKLAFGYRAPVVGQSHQTSVTSSRSPSEHTQPPPHGCSRVALPFQAAVQSGKDLVETTHQSTVHCALAFQPRSVANLLTSLLKCQGCQGLILPISTRCLTPTAAGFSPDIGEQVVTIR
jgi:hypothetical protein